MWEDFSSVLLEIFLDEGCLHKAIWIFFSFWEILLSFLQTRAFKIRAHYFYLEGGLVYTYSSQSQVFLVASSS